LANKVKRETTPFFPIFLINNFSIVDDVYSRINCGIGRIKNFKKK
jgi:hypothetical protein